MKVYVITSGEYSDYCIRTVALSREKAEQICAMLNSQKDIIATQLQLRNTTQTKFNVRPMRMLYSAMMQRLITKHWKIYIGATRFIHLVEMKLKENFGIISTEF